MWGDREPWEAIPAKLMTMRRTYDMWLHMAIDGNLCVFYHISMILHHSPWFSMCKQFPRDSRFLHFLRNKSLVCGLTRHGDTQSRKEHDLLFHHLDIAVAHEECCGTLVGPVGMFDLHRLHRFHHSFDIAWHGVTVKHSWSNWKIKFCGGSLGPRSGARNG